MKRIIIMAVIAAALAVASFGQGGAPATPAATPAPTVPKFKVGDMAPDFTLSSTAGTKVKLSDFRGKNNVVLAFYIFAFTGG